MRRYLLFLIAVVAGCSKPTAPSNEAVCAADEAQFIQSNGQPSDKFYNHDHTYVTYYWSDPTTPSVTFAFGTGNCFVTINPPPLSH